MVEHLHKVSLIISTKNRPKDLSALIESLVETKDNYYELLVIDSSTNNVVLNKNKFNTQRVGGKHIMFKTQGLSKARNHGLIESKGDIVVFIDDDFIVRKGWINNILPNFDDPKVACVTGRMVSFRGDETSQLYESSISFDRGSKKRIFSQKEIRITYLLLTIKKIGQKRLLDATPVPWAIGFGFMAHRKQFLKTIGGFDINLGIGTVCEGGEDVDVYYRLLTAGYKIVYEPTALVFHNHRKDFDNIFRTAYRAGSANKAFLSKYLASDNYLRCVYLSYFFWTFFSMLKAALKSEYQLKKMIKTELSGFLNL